jgi:DNA polymerase III delta prime subunit
MSTTDFLWVEEYRPKTIDDCILPQSLKTLFQSFIEKGEISNMLFSGTPGVGKTTVAKALCEQMNCDWIMINGSEEGGIDVLRNKIKNFASTVSLSGGKKVVILDEADYLNPQSTQPALRGFVEEFHKNCRFILTCNFKNRIIEPLHSRFSNIEFRINNKDKPKLASQLMDRAVYILKEQHIEYEDKALVGLITKHFPDFRKLINELQRYSVSGAIDAGVLVNISDENLKSLTGHLKAKEFGDMRKWVVNNLDNDPVKIFRKIYDSLNTTLQPETIPHAILIIADYQYKSAFVADQEINLVACLTELMSQVKFK